jgi:hypothetical protein
MKTIKANQTLTSRSICDNDCIFKLQVIERKGNFATIKRDDCIERKKIYTDFEGNEYLMPEKYSISNV